MKPGYRKTELGVFPEDWALVELKALIDETRGIRYGIVQPGAYEPDGRLMVRGQDYSKGWVDESCMFRVSAPIEERYRNARLREGDLIITIVGAGTGHVEVIPKWLDGANLTQTTARIAIDEDKANGQFCKYMLQSEIGQTQVANFLKGGAQPGLNCADVEKFFIPLPTEFQEQRAIAAALSDVDALIASLDTFIAKKRDIKQGAMQQLLTGKTRLPGFTGAWQTTALEEITDCLDNLRIPLNESQRSEMKGDIPYCGANGVLDYIDDYIIDDDIILMAEDGGYFEEYQHRPIAYRMSGKCWVNNHAHILKAKEGIDQDFVFYSVVHKNILRYLASGTRSKLNKSELEKIEIDIPNQSEEQEAISTILSDMDAEIAALERRRDKTRALKQGMMQELLTGRTRLI